MYLKYRHITLVLFVIWCGIIYTQNRNISGYIVDEENRETIIGATILIKGSTIGTTTDINGYFQLSVPQEQVQLEISHISYESKKIAIKKEARSTILDEIALKPVVNALEEISVIGIKPDDVGDKEIETSQLKLTPKAIQSIPSARNDVFRALKYLPGIEGTEVFSPLISVRGEDPGENKVILDGVTIYNPYHFATGSGIFNVQTIKNVDMFIGGYGAEFGGSNSSILHITTKEGNKNELHGEFYPSVMHSKVLLEFPAGKNSSIMLGGRYFYDLQSKFLLYNDSYFYDYNISYTNRINNKNWLSIKIFSSKDNTNYEFDKFYNYISNSFDLDFYEKMDMGINNNWDNLAANISLKKILSPSIYFNTQIYYSAHKSLNYSYLDMVIDLEEEGSNIDLKLFYNSQFESIIRDITSKTSLNFKLGHFNTLKTGVEYKWYYFNNNAVVYGIDNGDVTREPKELSSFIENKLKIGPVIFRPGIRYTTNSFMQHEYFEPRLNITINISKKSLLKAAYGIYYQNIISMNTMEYEINQLLDYYYPLKDIPASRSVHYILGFEKKLYNNFLSVKTNVYYKDIQRTYAFDLLPSISEIFEFSDKIQKGYGKAYGAEIVLEGTYKKFSGWVGYTWSHSVRSYPHILNGEEYEFEYNRRHSFKMLLNYQVNPLISYSTTLLALSGQPRTVETMYQYYYYYNPVDENYMYYPLSVSQKKNNVRMPMIIEWDIGLRKRLRKGFGAELQEFIHAEESYLNFTIGNLLFFKRNVIWYFPMGNDSYLPLGINYLPYFNVGYILKF